MKGSPRLEIIVCALWLCLAGAGFAVILRYQNTGGQSGPTPEQWPAGATLTLDRTRNTLIMFAHPQCPCTQASMEELNRLLARAHGTVSVQVWFFRPRQLPEGWAKSRLWNTTAMIPGVTVHEDLDGEQAKLFGAETSGYVLLYDPPGHLRFHGGITESRGHAGDNAGEDAIAALLAGKEPGLKETRVFGCSLLDKCELPAPGAVK